MSYQSVTFLDFETRKEGFRYCIVRLLSSGFLNTPRTSIHHICLGVSEVYLWSTVEADLFFVVVGLGPCRFSFLLQELRYSHEINGLKTASCS